MCSWLISFSDDGWLNDRNPAPVQDRIIKHARIRSDMKDDHVSTAVAGALVGAVSALPGASGATMLVVFGLYERLIAALSGLKRFIADIRFIVVLGISVAIGMLACSLCLDYVIDNWRMPAMFFFSMLILCQIPDLKSIEGRTEPAGKTWWTTFAIGLVVMVALFVFKGEGSVDPSIPAMVLVGAVFALAKMLPGVSGSTILVAIGLYDAFLDAIADLDFGYLVPMLVGAVVAVLLFAKAMKSCLENHRTGTFGLIMGMTVGSMVTVFADACLSMSGDSDILPAIAGIAFGLVAGYALRHLAKAVREKNEN